MRIAVTGSNGFIGGELIKHLNKLHYTDIIAIDKEEKDLSREHTVTRFIEWTFINEKNYFDFLNLVDFVFHLGANSSTREKFLDIEQSNVAFTSKLFIECAIRRIPVVFASSGAIYGSTRGDGKPNPLTDYGKTKLICEYMALATQISRIGDFCKTNFVCLRYHNVYGATESHKGNMASIISKWIDNYKNGIRKNQLFYGSDNIRRDFVHVSDINKVHIMFLDYYKKHHNLGNKIVYDVGTGISKSFQDVAYAISKHTKGKIEYVKNPYDDTNYQFFTKADVSDLKKIYKKTYKKEYLPLNIFDGIKLTFKQKTKKP